MLTVRSRGEAKDVPIARPRQCKVGCASRGAARTRGPLAVCGVRGLVLGTEKSAIVWGNCGLHGCRHVSVGLEVAAGGRQYTKGILEL